MLAEYKCKCNTIFFRSADHTGAVCPKCGATKGFKIQDRHPLLSTVERKGKVDLELDEWGDYGTDSCRGR